MEGPGGAWPRVVAHRCGGALAPENSLAGLEIAARLGCSAVEFDVMLSRDTVPVLMHDETLERTAGLPGRVPDLEGGELAAVDIGRLHHPAFAGECIPRLDTALERCRWLGLAANVEIKPADDLDEVTARAVIAVVTQCAERDRPAILFSSFSRKALEQVALALPAIPRALLAEHYDADILACARALGCGAVHLEATSLRASDVAAAHAAGLWLRAYTVNQVDLACRLVEWGVDGLFSDRPDRLLRLDALSAG